MLFDASGFTVDAPYEPNTLALVLGYMALSSALVLYIQFGLSFLHKGAKSDAVWEKTYFRGLGAFFIAVAASQFIYIADLLSRDIYDRRLFLTPLAYAEPFYSNVDSDYFVWIYTILLISFALLMYPVEKYLYAQKRRPITMAISIGSPVPLILRLVEIFHKSLGLQIGLDDIEAYRASVGSDHALTQHCYVMDAFWYIILGLIAISALYLLKLYLDLGRKSPPGSQLRKKSRMIVAGLFIWIASILTTPNLMKELSDAKSTYKPGYPNEPGTIDYVISSTGMFYAIPFISPALLVISLTLLVFGFTRKYDSTGE